MEENKQFRLSSLDDPTDEQLYAVMEKVGEDARESVRHAKAELDRRMAELHETIIRQIKARK